MVMEYIFEGSQMVELEDKNFKATIINMMTELKQTMFKELKEGMTMSHQILNINDQIEIIFKESY